MNESNYDQRQSTLSAPTRWRDLHYDIFGGLRAGGTTFVIYYGIFSRQPDANAPDVAADMLIRLAAVPIVAALLAYLIMRGRGLAMKTWETFRLERYNKGREYGVKMGREDLAREMLAFLDKQAPGEGVDALYDFLSKIRKNGNGESEQPRNQRRRRAG